MPAFLLDAPDFFPLPSLQAYTSLSVLLLSASLYYAFTVTGEPEWKVNQTLSVGGLTLGQIGDNPPVWSFGNDSSFRLGLLLENQYIVRALDILYLMLHEPLCIWTLINMAYCVLILAGRAIQLSVFGELRVSEQQNIKDRFWNFVFYKFIFIFGVMDVQYMDEVVLWCSWFSILGFLTLLNQLCKDRFEYLAFSPMTPKWTHMRLIALLCGILFCSITLFNVCILVGLNFGFSTFAFMAAECLLVMVKTLYVLIQYGIHLWDLDHQGVWENRTTYAYYTEFLFELTNLCIDFGHHIHMLIWGDILLSMASLVIIMQLRYLFYEIKRRYMKHQNYLQVVNLMEANFPMASHDELLRFGDDCAICWERMEAGRRLPCGHLFHNSCLRSWLEQDTSCPTCRKSLKARPPVPTNRSNGAGVTNHHPAAPATGNNTYQWNGSRYLSFLPVISIEFNRPRIMLDFNTGHRVLTPGQDINPTGGVGTSTGNGNGPSPVTGAHTSNSVSQAVLNAMVEQVIEWFPHIPRSAIYKDLTITRSVEATIENILEGNMNFPLNEPQPSTSRASMSGDSGASSSYHASEAIPVPTSTTVSSGDSINDPTDSKNESNVTTSSVSSTPSRNITDTSLPSTSSAVPSTESPIHSPLDSSSPAVDILASSSPTFSTATPTLSTPMSSPSTSFSSQTSSPSVMSPPKTYGGRFSKDPEERTKMYLERKADMIKLNRIKYLSNHPEMRAAPMSTPNETTSSTSPMSLPPTGDAPPTLNLRSIGIQSSSSHHLHPLFTSNDASLPASSSSSSSDSRM